MLVMISNKDISFLAFCSAAPNLRGTQTQQFPKNQLTDQATVSLTCEAATGHFRYPEGCFWHLHYVQLPISPGQ